ncbi:MAG TPA: hypothetical protein VGB64_07440 [Actinomycetota bacterium]
MTSPESRPLRWRIADRFSGRRGRNAILATGLLLVLLTGGLMLLRGFEARPLIYNDDGTTVRQRALRCAPAWTSITAAFDRTDPRTPDDVRTCVEHGRLKVFTAFAISSFLGIAAFGLSRLPERESRSPSGGSQWDRALSEARRRQNETRTGRPS